MVESTKSTHKHLAGGIGNEGDSAQQIYDELKRELSALGENPLTIVIFGASGHLARTKVIPSFYKLYTRGLIPENFTLLGYSRSKLTDSTFRDKIKPNLSKDALIASAEQLTPAMIDHSEDDDGKKQDSYLAKAQELAQSTASSLSKQLEQTLQLNPATHTLNVQKFLSHCHYHPGQYDKAEDIKKLDEEIRKYENNSDKGNRIFYLAIPPEIFGEVSAEIKQHAMSKQGITRVVVEKPFGKNRKEAKELNDKIAESFKQDQIFRVDHFLGKELIQQIPLLRFTNTTLQPIWNKDYISAIIINFKETAGIEGRGGYFDDYGMIRDVVQNHLLNIAAFLTMEPPSEFTKEQIQKCKADVMYAAEPIKPENLVIGQYTAGVDASGKKHDGYLDDSTTAKDSIAHTYCCQVLFINNDRWRGVPIVINAGKALNCATSTATVQFKQTELTKKLFETAKRDELVLDVLNSNILLRMNVKAPGLTESPILTEFDLYKTTAEQMAATPSAYERVLLDVLRGDNSLFVSAQEQDAMWAVVEDALNYIEKNKIKPEKYEFGSGGPQKAAELLNKFDIQWSGDLQTLQ